MLAQLTPPSFEPFPIGGGQPFPVNPGQDCSSLGPGLLRCTPLDQSAGVPAALVVILVLFWLAGIALAYYVTRDMARRGQSGCLWGALVLFGGWIGIIFWLIQRRQYPALGE